MTESVYESSKERLAVTITTVDDPTASGTIGFAFKTTEGDEPAALDYTSGIWSGSWDSVKKQATALTPTLPAAGAQVTLTAGTYYVWAKLTVGPEEIVHYIDQLVVE